MIDRAKLVQLIAALGLSLAVPAVGAEDAMRVHFIDVGQGAATLVEFPCATVLIDTGGERWPKEEWKPAKYDSTQALMKYLNGFFKGPPDIPNELALLILTHPHKDHTRGVPAVLDAFTPKSVVHNGQWHGSGIEEQTDARDYAKENPAVSGWYVLERTIPKDEGLSNTAIDSINCGSVDPKIRVLWGQVRDDNDWDYDDFSDENNHSVVVRIDFGEASLLITGDLEEATRDGEQAGLERLVEAYKDSDLLDVDVYHVGHHGSHNGTTPALVEAMSPEIAMISAGPACERDGYSAWNHAHPRSVTVDDLEKGVTGTRTAKNVKVFERHKSDPVTRRMEKAIYSTGWDGTVVLEGRSDGRWSLVKTTGPDPCLN